MSGATQWKADPSEAQYEKKRERIISAAAKVITKKGLANLKLESIAEEISINRSTYYRYFSSKEELIRAVLNKEFDILNAEISKLTTHIEDPIEMVIEGIYQTLKAHRTNKRLVELLGPNSKDCIRLNQIALEIYPEKTAPIVSLALNLPWENASKAQQQEVYKLVRWMINIILSMSIFGSGGLKAKEEKELLVFMLQPVLEKVLGS